MTTDRRTTPAAAPRQLAWSTALRIAAAVAMAAPGLATAAGTDASTQQRYQTESAACASKATAEDKKTCLKEAGAAREEASRNRLAKPGADLAANAKLRCEALPGDQKTACLARMDGAGTTSGSVEGGGVLRELTVRSTAPGVAGGASAVKP